MVVEKCPDANLPLPTGASDADARVNRCARRKIWGYVTAIAVVTFLGRDYLQLPSGDFDPFSGVNTNCGGLRHTGGLSGKITWTPCGEGGFECGRFDVPLNHLNTTSGATASLAVARLLAKNRKKRLGSVYVNPGGPGGSGVNFLYRAGQSLSKVLDDRYDIVSWDPRGINETTPRIECFKSQTAQDIFLAHTSYDTPLEIRLNPKSSNGTSKSNVDAELLKEQLRIVDARTETLFDLCWEFSQEKKKSSDGYWHISTATVVRDLEALAREIDGVGEPINFIGYSYGTVIGSYLVNMFPHRMGRVVIDGVVDPVTWSQVHLHEWPKLDYVDTEKDYLNFVRACAEVGPSRCALSSNTTTAESLEYQLDQFLNSLYGRPLSVPHADRPGVLTSGQLKGLIFSFLYRPRSWPLLAEMLSAALKGDGAPILNYLQDDIELDKSKKARTTMAIDAITCVDTPVLKPEEVEGAVNSLATELTLAQETSPRFGGVESSSCFRWKGRDVERYTGPFNVTGLEHGMLVIGNTADPITPVVNARTVNGLIPDSRLVVQNGSGHCSLAMASLCTGKILRNYFLEGKLPPNGIVCETDEKLFPDPTPSGSLSSLFDVRSDSDLTPEDRRILEGLHGLGVAVSSFEGGVRGRRDRGRYEV